MAFRKVAVSLMILAAFSMLGPAAAEPIAKGEADNAVTGLEVQSGPASTQVILKAQKVPTFTVFKLQNPDRLVVDLIRTDLQGIDSPRDVSDSRVGQIATTQFRQAGSVVSRVLIGLKPGARFDAKADGDRVVVTITAKDQTAPAQVAAPSVPAPVEPAIEVEETTPSAAKMPQQESSPNIAQSDATTAAPVAAQAQNAQATDKDFKVVLSQGDKTKVKPVGIVRIASGANDSIAVFTTGEVTAFEVLEVVNPFRVVVDVYGATMRTKVLERALKGKVATRVRAAKHPDKVRLVIDGLKDPEQIYRVQPIKGGLQVQFGRADVASAPKKELPAKVVVADTGNAGKPTADKQEKKSALPEATQQPPVIESKPSPAVTQKAPATIAQPQPKMPQPAEERTQPAKPEPTPAPIVAKAAAPSAKSVLKDLAFRQEGNQSRVILELEGDAVPQVVHSDDRSVVLEIPQCQMPVLLERTLDTSEFKSALKSLSAYRVQGEDKIKLVAVTTSQVPNRLERRAGKVQWVFETAGSQASEEPSSAQATPAESTEYVYAPDEVAGYSVRRPELASGDGGSGLGSEKKQRFTGRRITLDFKDIDIHNVLRLISDVAKLNIVTSDDVAGKVTLSLRNVPWDQALDIILRSKKLGKVHQGNIIRVAKQEDLIKEQEQAAKIAEAMKPLEPLRVRIISINYATAADVEKQVKGVLSERGSVTTDTRTNVLIIKDTLENLVKAEGLVRSLDTETPQVLIEARIVEANTQYIREVGVQWGGDLSFSSALGNPTGLPFPSTAVVSGGADDPNTNTQISGTANPGLFAINLPAAVGAGSGGAVGFIFGSAGGAAHLNLRLSALENKGAVKIVSAPKITTLDNHQARIGQGVSIPISVVSAAGVNTIFVEAKLQLQVTPHITQEGSILMNIEVAKNEPDFSRTGARGDPTILKKEAQTQVMVHDGDTTVIGGIYTKKTSDTFTGVPVLSHIPILGWFFRNTKNNDDRTELLIFITPRIVNRLQSTVSSK